MVVIPQCQLYRRTNIIHIACIIYVVIISLQVTSSHFQYTKICDNNKKTMTLMMFDRGTSYYDVYAVGWRSTCGKQAGTVTGNGTATNPYWIVVDLSRGMASQKPNCGVQMIGKDLYQIAVKSIKTCEKPSAEDSEYSMVCELTGIPASLGPPLSQAPHKVIANASHVCRPPDTIEFRYNQQHFQPFDIYAIEGRQTCSRCSGSGTGLGSLKDPYLLVVNVTDPNQWYGCRGTQLKNNVYNLKILVQQAEFIIQNSDVLYNIMCDFNQMYLHTIRVTSGLSVGGEPPQNNATQESAKVSLSVVSSDGITPVQVVTIGDRIRLKVTLQPNTLIAGIQVKSCEALPRWDGDMKITILNDKGCSTGERVVPPFRGVDADGSTAMTEVFEAFKFAGYTSIYFRCTVKFCYDHTDKRCSGSHCSNYMSRQRRSEDGEEQQIDKLVVTSLLIQGIETDQLGATTQSSNVSSLWKHSILAAITLTTLLTLLSLILIFYVICRMADKGKQKLVDS